MKHRTSFWVEFMAPGPFTVYTWTAHHGLAAPQPDTVVWPDKAYAFRILKRPEVVDGDEVFRGDTSQVGPTYYHPDSEVVSSDALAYDGRATEILRSNCRCNGWDAVVFSRWGNWPQPFDPEESVVLTADVTMTAAEMDERGIPH